MSIFGEFTGPAETSALYETLRERPEAAIEIERVVATEEVLTPYFWMSGTDGSTFEAAAETDPSVYDLGQLDHFDQGTLYRAEWTRNVNGIAYAYTTLDASILEATGQHETWKLRIRFDSRNSTNSANCERDPVRPDAETVRGAGHRLKAGLLRLG